MSITLNPQTEARVREKISVGPYRTSDEVIEEALRLLDARDQRIQSIRESVKQGIEALDRGEGVVLTEASMMERGELASIRLRNGEQPDPDVCP